MPQHNTLIHQKTFFPTLKTRPEFLKVKKLGHAWASASFIIQGLIDPKNVDIPDAQASAGDHSLINLSVGNHASCYVTPDGLQASADSNMTKNSTVVTAVQNQHISCDATLPDISQPDVQSHVINPQIAAIIDYQSTNGMHIDKYHGVKEIIATSQDDKVHLAASYMTNQDAPTISKDANSNNVAAYNNVADSTHSGFNSLVDLQAIKIGYVATKKLGNAVARNRAKRRMRELCKVGRLYFKDMPAEYVIIARHPILKQSFDVMLKELAWTLKHVHRLHNEQVSLL